MFLKARLLVPVLVAAAWLAVPLGASADDTKTLDVRLTVRSATSLRVSSSMLRFDVTDPASPGTVEVEFWAAARTYWGGEVLLTIEPAGTMQTPVGGPSGDLKVEYHADGEVGTLGATGASRAGRWIGSGVREGRVSFTLHGAVTPGTYTVPVRFVLSTP